MPRSGSGPPTSWRSSASWRSPAGSAARAASLRASEAVPGSTSSSSPAASLAARSRRSGSAAKLRSPDHAQDAAVEVGEAAERVDRLAAGERHRDRPDREVALGQVGLDRLSPQRRHVDLPGAVGGDGAPGGELGRELERVAPALAGDRLGDSGGVAGHGEVEVGHVAPERRVAHCAAGDPDALGAGKRISRQRHDRRRGKALRDAHAGSRGTLAEIPQVTS